MILAGGTFPGFGPFIRSTARLGEEHTTWRDTRLAAGDSVFLELSGCVARYHAPLGRLVHVGGAPDRGARHGGGLRATPSTAVVGGAAARARPSATSMPPGRASSTPPASRITGATIAAMSSASACRRAGPAATRSRVCKRDSELVVKTGMSFHVLSWLMGTGRGDFFISNTVLLGENGPEVLTRTPAGVTVR